MTLCSTIRMCQGIGTLRILRGTYVKNAKTTQYYDVFVSEQSRVAYESGRTYSKPLGVVNFAGSE
jgi:hypothetical protein